MAIYFGRDKQKITINDSYLAGSISKPLKPKEVTYESNGTYNVYPYTGTLLSQVTVNVDVDDRYTEGYEIGKADGIIEGKKSVKIQPEKTAKANGTIEPDEGYDALAKVNVNVTNVDTINGWHIEVLTDDSEPEDTPYPKITFVCKEG